MAIVNHVDMGKLEQVMKEGQADKSKLKRTQKIEGEWNLAEGGPQFQATVSYEGGKTVLASDQPSNLGGGGTLPGPLHYCFFGLLSCYTATFATMASMQGIKLKKLSARVEGDLNFSRVFGLSNDPIMEEIRIVLKAESEASKEQLKELEKLAYERCPAVFALTQNVKLKPTLELG